MKTRSRTVVLAFVCLGHVAVILLLAQGIARGGWHAPAQEPEPLRLLLLDNPARAELPRPADIPAPMLTSPVDVVVAPLSADIGASGSALALPVSDSMPRVDWIDERRREVANVVTREAAGRAGTTVGAQTSGVDRSPETFEPADRVVARAGGARAPRACDPARASAGAGAAEAVCRRAKR